MPTIQESSRQRIANSGTTCSKSARAKQTRKWKDERKEAVTNLKVRQWLRQALTLYCGLVLLRQGAHPVRKQVRSSEQLAIARRLGCCALRIISTEVARESAPVIRVDLCVVLTARYRHTRKTVVNRQF